MTKMNEPPQNKKITLGLIFSWGFGVLLLLSSVMNIFNPNTGVLMNVCFFIASLFLLPPIRKLVFEQTNKTLSSGVRISIVIILMAFGGASSSEFQSINQNSYSSSIGLMQGNIKEDNLIIEGVKFSKGEFGNKIISGFLKNTTSDSYKYAQIEFNLYDKNGVQVGSTFANINNLEPYGTWKFEAMLMKTSVKTFKVKNITAF